MHQPDIQKTLQSLGLIDKEIKTYLALLTIGTAPASLLGKRTGIVRSSSKYICDRLTHLGLFHAIPKKSTVYYNVEPPEKLFHLLDLERQTLDKKEAEIQKIINPLNALMNPNIIPPKIKFFEGVDEVIDLIGDVLKKPQTIYGALRIDDKIHPQIAEYHEQIYIPKRIKLSNPAYMIFNNTLASRQYHTKDFEMNRISLLVDNNNFPFDTCVHIYEQKVAFYSYRIDDVTGVLIENKYIKNSLFSLFKLAWETAKKMAINKQYQDAILPSPKQ